MTIILTLGCSDYVVQASDRRLISNGRLVDDEANKAGVLECRNARLAFGFTGLATVGRFNTRLWLLDALYDAGPPDYFAKGIIDRFAEKATETFATDDALRSVHPRDKRLSVIFSGYLYHHDPPLMVYAIVTNYQDAGTGTDRPEARSEFQAQYWQERRPWEGPITLVQRIGAWHAMTDEDEGQLRTLLRLRKPARATIGKVVDVMRRIADRRTAKGAIGKQISTIRIPVDRSQPVQSGYHTHFSGYVCYMADYVVAVGDDNRTAVRDIQFQKIGGPTDAPLIVPKAGRNAPCPCGSGKKYKFCHGHWRLTN